MKVFSCVSYVLIDSSARSKLDSKSKLSYFVGYGDSELGYHLWDDQNQKIVRSKDVVFNKAILYKDRAIKSEGKKLVTILLKIFSKIEDGNSETHWPMEVGESSGSGGQETEAPEEVPTTPFEVLRRSSRIPRPPQRYSPSLHYILLTDRGEPESYDEAMEDKESVKWELAMKDEMDSLMSNQTWRLAELPKGKKALHNKWVYHVKEEHHDIKRYKERLVVKGFQQKEGINYNEIFSPVVKLTTIKIVLTLVARDDLSLEQMDVKAAFSMVIWRKKFT